MKQLIALMLGLLITGSAFSQTGSTNSETKATTQVIKRGEFNDWFFGVNGGAQVFFGDHDKQMDFGDRITGKFQIYGGKWLNESFGIRAGVNGWKIKGLTQTHMYSTGEVYDASQWLETQKFNYFNVHADLMFHWFNDADGQNLNRFYNIIPYAGIGLAVVTNDPGSVKFSPNLGLMQTFRLTDKLDLTVDVMGNIMGDGFDGEIGNRNYEGSLSTMIGIQYNLRK
ncbi:hypothetical protein [Sphingobacterium lactis]|uniref:hypothetical protein n=1 Tax=Sphingobacterium lactis TaxID=797291 RepID=UPI003DA4DC36